jgi:hypothetical protein
VSMLPVETLPFLLASRYCETELLNSTAWYYFGGIQGGWARVQAICDFVHERLTFSYPNARPTRTALEAFNERTGVCRDFTHLAVALCRCMNIPARYCNGYLGDIGIPADPAPMDFNAWFEAYRRPLVHVRRAPQHRADWPNPCRARPRRDGHSHDPYLRPACTGELHGYHRGGAAVRLRSGCGVAQKDWFCRVKRQQ